MKPTRINLGVLLIIVIAGLSAMRLTVWLKPFDLLQEVVEAGGVPLDPLTRYERRFDCLREQLDPDEIIGFAASVDPEQYTEYYLLTQYTLAPVLVAYEVGRPRIAGFFPSTDASEQIAELGLEVLVDCDTGAFLLEPGPVP